MGQAYLMEWKGILPGQFSRLVEIAGWQVKFGEGNVVYENLPGGGRLLAVGAWANREDFERFYEQDLHPALEETGIGRPVITTWAMSGQGQVRHLQAQAGLAALFGPRLDLHASPGLGTGAWN